MLVYVLANKIWVWQNISLLANCFIAPWICFRVRLFTFTVISYTCCFERGWVVNLLQVHSLWITVKACTDHNKMSQITILALLSLSLFPHLPVQIFNFLAALLLMVWKLCTVLLKYLRFFFPSLLLTHLSFHHTQIYFTVCFTKHCYYWEWEQWASKKK
jgi:hypothetical protein